MDQLKQFVNPEKQKRAAVVTATRFRKGGGTEA
jgi:hypothetical protein